LTGSAVQRDEAFRDYVAARAEALRFTAYLLCGDWHEAEDIAQTALIKLYVAWNRIDHTGSLDGYVRRIIARTFLNERRRSWRKRERLVDRPPEPATTAPAGPEERMLIWAALSKVPKRQRAALVLRYWEDLSLDETAEALGCSVGNVKSQCARGLRTLRDLLAAQGVDAKGMPTGGTTR
jgi:RNA polymerase sigma-70 factor (sigma-E family)